MRRFVLKKIQKFSGKKVYTTALSILGISAIILLITGMFSNVRGLVLDELLITIALIICLTDNLMLKNSDQIINDFSALNELKNKINDYSIMEDRDIEQINLWDQYLAYAVAFGCAKKIMNRIKVIPNDDDLMKLCYSGDISDFIYDDYYYFYREASLDARFLNGYGKSIERIAEKIGDSDFGNGSHGGSGGGFSGGGGFHGGGGRGRRPEVHFKI